VAEVAACEIVQSGRYKENPVDAGDGEVPGGMYRLFAVEVTVGAIILIKEEITEVNGLGVDFSQVSPIFGCVTYRLFAVKATACEIVQIKGDITETQLTEPGTKRLFMRKDNVGLRR